MPLCGLPLFAFFRTSERLTIEALKTSGPRHNAPGRGSLGGLPVACAVISLTPGWIACLVATAATRTP
jgi:hypothetical protein